MGLERAPLAQPQPDSRQEDGGCVLRGAGSAPVRTAHSGQREIRHPNNKTVSFLLWALMGSLLIAAAGFLAYYMRKDNTCAARA